jgi:hypothetical protein
MGGEMFVLRLPLSAGAETVCGVFEAFAWPCPYKPQLLKFTGLRAEFGWICPSLLRVEDRSFRYTFQQNQLMPLPISQLFQRIDLNIFCSRNKNRLYPFSWPQNTAAEHCVFVYIMSSDMRNQSLDRRCYLLHTGFSLDLFFDREDRGEIYLRNIS